VRHLRTLLSLILTNSEVRKLLSDFSVIGRDLLAKGASKAAEALRPDKEALSRVDEPASEGEFVAQGGRKLGTGETPVLDVDIPRTDEPMIKTSQGEEATGGQALGEGQQTVRPAQELTSDVGEQATERAQQRIQKTKESVEVHQ
jgi:hypothetical protein